MGARVTEKGDCMSDVELGGAGPFHAVIFDMDGVLVDTEDYYLRERRAFLAQEGVSVEESELVTMVGASAAQDLASMMRWFSDAGRPVTEDDINELEAAWWRGHDVDYAALLNPGVTDTLERLKARGVRLALASSSRMVNILEVLGACGIADAFEVITSGEQFAESKPNPEIYLHTLEQLGFDATQCCCVEDSVPGIAAGKAAGLTVIAKREERFGFSQDAADVIVDDIPGVLDIVLPAREG